MVCACPTLPPCTSLCSSLRCTTVLSQTLTLSTPLTHTHASLQDSTHSTHSTRSAGPVGRGQATANTRGGVRTVSRARMASAAQSTALEQPHTALQSLLRNTPPHTPSETHDKASWQQEVQRELHVHACSMCRNNTSE